MVLPRAATTVAIVLALVVAGCGGKGKSATTATAPAAGASATTAQAAASLGFPDFATKNTTRVAGADPVANAAGVARAVYTGATQVTRPHAVVLADDLDWRVGLAASVLMSAPLRAPLLYSDAGKLPPATADALKGLRPTGASEIAGAQLIRVGAVPAVPGYKASDIRGADPITLAKAIDAYSSAARGRTSDRVLVVSADEPAFAMPAAGWAAKGGDPILFTHKDAVPAATLQAITTHQQPKIYVLGPASVVSDKALDQLRRLGSVTRISGPDPVTNAIAFARFLDGSFGWGVVDPGHGLVFASDRHPADAGAAAPLSASGTYGPLLVLEDPTRIPAALRSYLLDIQPGYPSDPVRGVYNHGWIIGDQATLSVASQSTLDALLEIVPVHDSSSGATTTP